MVIGECLFLLRLQVTIGAWSFGQLDTSTTDIFQLFESKGCELALLGKRIRGGLVDLKGYG